MKLSFILTSLLFVFQVHSQEVLMMPLWPNQVPNSRLSTFSEKSVMVSNHIRVSQITDPTIEVFLPASPSESKKAVLICPGGGYSYLVYDRAGTQIAKKLNEKGIVGVVLKYRLPDDELNEVPHVSPLTDAQRAMELIRENAAEWGIDPFQVGVMGFSAGGHLASTLGTHFQKPNRPDFMILIYPVVTMKTDFTHMGSRINLIGENPPLELERHYSNELQVTKDTPPTFIVHTEDDKVVPIENSLQLFAALKVNEVPVEMHLYPYGGHGFGLAEGKGRLSGWFDLMTAWIAELK